MNEQQAEFIRHAAEAIEDVITMQSPPCEIVHDIWSEGDRGYCRICEIGALAQRIRMQLDDYIEEHPEIYE